MTKTPDPAARTLADLAAARPGGAAADALAVLDAPLAIAFAGGLAGTLAAAPDGDVGMCWLALMASAALARGVAAAGLALRGARAAEAVRRTQRRRVAEALLHGAAVPEATAAGLAVDEVEALDGGLARFVPARRAAALGPLLVLGAVAIASPLDAAILGLAAVPFGLLMAFAGQASAAESRRQFTALARLGGLFADRLRALPVLLAYNAVPAETARLARQSRELAGRTNRVLRRAFLSSAVLEFFAALCVALVAVHAGFALLGLLPAGVPGPRSLGRAFFVLALAPEFYAPLRRLAAAYHDRRAALTAAERLEAFVASARSATRRPLAAPPSLRAVGVTVRHPGADGDAVTGIDFAAPAGSLLVLLGPSGSGKTSVLRALLGLADVSAGRLEVDGVALDGAGLAGGCAWIGAAPLLVAGTLRDNLRLAAPAADDAALLAALDRVGLGSLCARRDGGLDAVLDARGGGLSGGERRRLAFARAVLADAPLWLLDEPTAHLDEGAERALIALVGQVRGGRTLVVATHSARLAAIADVVVRLDGAPADAGAPVAEAA